MGYTHYWKNSEFISFTHWGLVCYTAYILFDNAKKQGLELWSEYDEPDTAPIVCQEFIKFNGAGKEGHETFYLTREPSNFEFCKTAVKPYDMIVGALLWEVAKIVPTFSTTNDGGISYLTGQEY